MKQQIPVIFTTSAGISIPVRVADSFSSRFFGLMGKKEGTYGLLLSPCNSIHTCFMRYRMDAIFLDDHNRVVALRKDMKPFRATRIIRNATKVLEFPSSLKASDSLTLGMEIQFN